MPTATLATETPVTETFSRALPGTKAAASEVRAEFRDWLHDLHAGTEDEQDDLILAFGETLANSVIHGSPRGAEDTVTVAATWDGVAVSVSVADQGNGYDREKVPDPDPLRPGGWGLHLTRTVTDAAWPEFPGTGTVYRLVKRLTTS